MHMYMCFIVIIVSMFYGNSDLAPKPAKVTSKPTAQRYTGVVDESEKAEQNVPKAPRKRKNSLSARL